MIGFAGPWVGEFGWEIMTWVPYLRKLSHDYEKMYISTFQGMEPLYSGFHCGVEFLPHEYRKRTDSWTDTSLVKYRLPPAALVPLDEMERIMPIKEYKVDGEYVRYGSPAIKDVAILFHARGVDRFGFKNWPVEKWEVLAKEFPGATSIGSKDDLHVPGTRDCRGAELGMLMDCIASAAIVIGQSSGVMHLASMWGTPQLVWADNKTYFNEPLEKRYKETWNPFHTRVTWIDCDNWNPDPEQILEALKPRKAPTPQVLSSIHDAVESEQYIVAIAWMGERDGKPSVSTNCIGVSFPDAHLDRAGEQLASEVRNSIAKAQAKRMPVSWI
jgi:hypothetical protein